MLPLTVCCAARARTVCCLTRRADSVGRPWAPRFASVGVVVTRAQAVSSAARSVRSFLRRFVGRRSCPTRGSSLTVISAVRRAAASGRRPRGRTSGQYGLALAVRNCRLLRPLRAAQRYGPPSQVRRADPGSGCSLSAE
ncbi:hypothetical protein OH77DRAFT_578242 [Trametes cingulata]|nr:hypothetical protein OH77DRAFT_578242 [Trametes cingulata]